MSTIDPQYRKNVYNALKQKVEGFNKSEDEFNKALEDPQYVKNVYGALKQKVEGFNKSEDEFSNLLSSTPGGSKSFTPEPKQPDMRDIQRGAAKQATMAPTTSREDIAKYETFQPVADSPVNIKDHKLRKTVQKEIKSFDKKFRPDVARIREYVSTFDASDPEAVKKELNLPDDYNDQVNLAIQNNSNEKNYLNTAHPYESDITGEDPEFVNQYFNSSELEKLGFNPKDFDGFLDSNDIKKGFRELDQKGLFQKNGTSNILGTSGTHDAALSYDLHRLNVLNAYFDDNIARDKELAAKYLKQINSGNDSAIPAYNDTMKRIDSKTKGYQEYISKNLPSYVQYEKDKMNELKDQYRKYKEGHADEFLNWGRGAWNGAVNTIHSLSATIYDKLGATDTADQIRLAKEQDERFSSTPDLYYISETGRKVNHNGTNYIVTNKGEIIDTDDKLKATALLEPSDYSAIMESAKKSNDVETSNSLGGAVQQASGVIGDMALQLLLTKGVSSARAIGTSTTEAAGRKLAQSTTVRAVENALGRTTLGRELYTRAAAKAIAPEVSSLSKLYTKASKIPAVYGDVLITQGAYGYSTGYENAYNQMIEAGHSEEDARKLASEAGNQIAALYAATSFISPQANVLQMLEGDTTKSLISKAIGSVKPGGLTQATQVLASDVKNKIVELTKKAATVAGEGTKEAVQENIQQYAENTIVNKNLNELAGDDMYKTTYTLEDFVNTTALAFGAATILNSPTLLSGTDKIDIISQLAQNRENFETSLKEYTQKGFTTQEKADDLRKDVEVFSKYRTMLPKEVSNNVAMDAMRILDRIDQQEIEMKNVHPALRESYKKGIENQKTQLNQLLNNAKISIQDTEGKYTQAKEVPVADSGKTSTTTQKDNITLPDSGITTTRDSQWDQNTKDTLPESSFESEDQFKQTLTTGQWGMLTAENPNAQQVSDDQNFNNNERAIKWLKERGYNPQPIFGKYGNSENSLFVEGLTKQDAQEFATEFNQKSVATNEGLVYQNGDMNPIKKGSESFESKPDMYSSIKIGDKLIDYSVDYDWDTTIKATDTVTETQPQEEITPDKYKEVADKIRGLKFYQTPSEAMKNLNTDLSAPLKAAWDSSMEIIALSVEAGGNISSAVNKGVANIKASEWYKSLDKSGKSRAIEIFKDEATKNLTPFYDSLVKPKKENVKSTIRKTTGQVDLSPKVETTEKKMLEFKLKTADQAQKAERAFTSKNRSTAVANIRSLVESLSKKGIITPAIMKSMIKGAVNMDVNNPEKIKQYMDKVRQMIDKANNRGKIAQIKTMQRALKRLPKTVPSNIRELGKVVSTINPRYLTGADLDQYMGILYDVKASTLPAQNKNQQMVNVESTYDTLEKLQDKVEQARIQEIKDSLELLGLDLTDMKLSDQELKDFWENELNVTEMSEDDHKAELLRKAKTIESQLADIAEGHKEMIKSYSPDSSLTSKTKSVLKSLKEANFDFMDVQTIKQYIKVAQNIMINDDFSGAGEVAAQITALNNTEKFIRKVIESGVPLGEIKIDTKLTKGNFLNDLKSLALLMKEVYKTPELMGQFNYFSGLDEWSKGQTKTTQQSNLLMKELDKLFNDLVKTNKSLRESHNTMLRGIVANLIQGDTPEEFKVNKSRIEDHIQKDPKHSAEVQTIYNEFKGFNSQQEVLDHLKSRKDGNYEIVKFWMDKFAEMKDDLAENTEVVHNELFNEVAANYLPIKIKVDTGTSPEFDKDKPQTKGSTYNNEGIASPKQSPNTIKRNKSKKLPVNGLLDLDFDAAMLNRYKRGLNDINTSSAVQVMRGFFGNKSIAALMGKSNTSAFIKRINYMQNLNRGLLNETSDVEKVVSNIERFFKRIGVVGALGGVTAIIKQTVPVMTAVAAQIGAKNFGMFITNFRAAQNNTLIQNYSTSLRGESTLGTRSIIESANDMNRFKGTTSTIAKYSNKTGQFFDKTKDVLMKPLQYGDEAIAKASWTTYYLEYLKKNGYDINNIDLSKEHEYIENDETRRLAASYAEVRVEETQVASDTQRSASLFSNPHAGVAALRSIFLPFQQFNINSKMRMTMDISELMNRSKNSKLANKVSTMSSSELIDSVLNGKLLNNEHVTKDGFNSSTAKAWRSLGANIVEQTMFQGVKAYALTLFTSHAAALFSFLIDDEDDSERHEEWLSKEIDWSFKTKQFYSALVKDINPLTVGTMMESSQIDLLNYAHYLFGEDNEEFQTYKQWADAYTKENGSLPWYRYKDDGTSGYGVYSIAVDIGGQIMENADFAYDGHAYMTNDWGKEEEYILANDSQLRFMRLMFAMECLRATTGVEADTYRELEKVRKELVKTAKVTKE